MNGVFATCGNKEGNIGMYRVLIVDDEHLIRSSLTKKVEQYSETVTVSGTAENGMKALQWLEQYYADILITDVRMPLMDGLACIGTVKQLYPWMACIVVSSYDDFQYAKSSLQLGALDYILKPIHQQSLNDALTRACEHLSQTRHLASTNTLVRRLPHFTPMLQRWLNQIQTVQVETMPLLVVDTLEMLEEWSENNFHLLNALSMTWLQLVNEELKKEKMEASLQEGDDLGLWDKTVPLDKVRSYFRLSAVRRLEEGAARLFLVGKEAMEHPTRKVIEEVKAYIREQYARKTSLQEIADRVNISRNYLANVFKQETGSTIWNYLTSVRMEKARELLLSAPFKIYQIAHEVGYEDHVHFSQVFKEYYGITPMEYKKRMEK